MSTTYRNMLDDVKLASLYPGIAGEVIQDEVKTYYREIERYDWISDTKYPEKLFHLVRAKTISSIVNRLIQNENTTILDVGCGTGLITSRIRGGEITALDMNRWNLERAKMHTAREKVTFVPGDAEALPCSSNSFDIVICTEVLEHLLRPDLALKEINRVLKPGSFFVGSVPTKSIIWKYRKYISTSSPAAEPFHNNFTVEEFKPLLANFKIINMKYGAFGLTLFFIVQKYKL
jgi:ubiquinone/menaquinone biosynthesis C-methylase UbiE